MSKKRNIVSDTERLKVPHGLWFFCDIPLWYHRCFLFIGTKEEMYDSFEKGTYINNLTRSEVEYARKWLERHLGQNKEDAFGINNTSFIRLSDFTIGKIDDIAFLEHECLHVANAILCEIGVQGDDNREVLAYTQEFIFKDLMVKVMKQLGLSPIKVE